MLVRLRPFVLIAAWFLTVLAGARAFEATPKIAHFTSDGREAGFVLDQSGPNPRVRFDGQDEILAGWWRPAAGGDRILTRDDGVLILRQNVAGGITVFTPRFPMGIPVGFDRPSMPLEGPPPLIDTVRDTAVEAGSIASQSYRVSIRFEGPWDQASNDAGLRAILFDAVQNANLALQTVARDPDARTAVARQLRGVRFSQGDKPGVARQRSIAVVFYTLDHGVASRPSSYRIANEIRLQFR